MSQDWPDYSPTSLASLLSGHVVATQTALEQMIKPAPGSRMAMAAPKPSLYGAYSSAYIYLGSGLDHMNAVVAALRSPTHSYLATYTLNRVVLESSARAYWLLDERVGSGTRIARALLDRMDSVWNHSLLYPAGDKHYEDAQRHLQERTSAILAAARDAGLNTSVYGEAHERHGQPQRMAGQERPGPTKAVDELLASIYVR